MRVLFVTHAFPRWSGDGAGAFILRLARALSARGTAVHVLAPAGQGLFAEDTVDGIPVSRFRYAPDSWETLAYTGTMAEQVRASWRAKAALVGMLWRGARAVRAAVAATSADVVHAHWWFPGGLMVQQAAVQRPFVTTLHGSDVRLARQSALAPARFRRVVAQSSAVTAVSSWLAAEARAMAPGIEPDVAPMPVDVDLFTTGRAPRHAARVLFVGRLNAQKGIAVLLDALALVEGTALDVVGDGPDRPALEARARALGIGARVAWLGSRAQPELVPLYQAATSVVVPSENEGLGLVAVEAQLCGAPVIAFRSGGLTDVVRDGETGLLTPPGDARALAGAMHALLARPDHGASLGAAGRAAAMGRFAPATVAERYQSLYERIAHRVA